MTDSPVPSSEGPFATSLSLLERARASDPAAWRRMAELYEPLVERWCRRAGLQAADAADVRQEVLLAVARRVGEFRHGLNGGTFRGWLKTIARNKLRDFWRKVPPPPAIGTAALDELPTAEDADEQALSEELRLLHRRALELIERDHDPRTWRAFWRVVVEGGAPADVAAELGVSVNVVYLAKSRVLAGLRAEFADLLDP